MKRWSFRWLPGLWVVHRFRFRWGWRMVIGPLWIEHVEAKRG